MDLPRPFTNGGRLARAGAPLWLPPANESCAETRPAQIEDWRRDHAEDDAFMAGALGLGYSRRLHSPSDEGSKSEYHCDRQSDDGRESSEEEENNPRDGEGGSENGEDTKSHLPAPFNSPRVLRQPTRRMYPLRPALVRDGGLDL